jgi:hypothetical protein
MSIEPIAVDDPLAGSEDGASVNVDVLKAQVPSSGAGSI